MSGRAGARFEVEAEFLAFVRTDAGKRRMLVRSGGAQWHLKVPKPLRKQLADQMTAGDWLAISGIEQTDSKCRAIRRVAVEVHVVTPASISPPKPCATCTIRVCAKNNCWKDGGHALWKALAQHIAARALGGAVKLKAVGCLDNCKRAPNAMAAGQLFERCDPASAEAIVSRALAAARHRAEAIRPSPRKMQTPGPFDPSACSP